jgi:hypothetical protein
MPRGVMAEVLVLVGAGLAASPMSALRASKHPVDVVYDLGLLFVWKGISKSEILQTRGWPC